MATLTVSIQQLAVQQVPQPLLPPNITDWVGMRAAFGAIWKYLYQMREWTNRNVLTPAAANASSAPFFQHVTGSPSISTITLVGGTTSFNGILVLIGDAAFSLATGGNIARALSVNTGGTALLVFDPATSTWYPQTS